MHFYSPLYIVLYYVSCIYALYFIKLISENQYVALFSRKLQHFICIFTPVLAKFSAINMSLFLRLGTFQISDLFFNTIGGLAGGIIYFLVNAVAERMRRIRN